MMGCYHRIIRIISTKPIHLNCLDCRGGDEVWPIDDDVQIECGADFSISRVADKITLDGSGAGGAVWEIPSKLYHGTSLSRFREMLAKPKTFELYLAIDPAGAEMYASEAAGMDESEEAVITVDTQKLLSLGKLMPDWDDVDQMIRHGETDAEGNPLFGNADSAQEVTCLESLQLIGTCSYEGDFRDAIIEAHIGPDNKVVSPPFDKSSVCCDNQPLASRMYHGTASSGLRTSSRYLRAVDTCGTGLDTISFDFDDVLHYAPGGNPIDFWTPESYVPRERYVAKLRSLSPTHRIIVVSHRDPGMENVVYEFAKMHDLDIDDVFCVGVCGSKRQILEDENAMVHYDDSPYVESELRKSKIKLIKVPRTAINDLTWVPDNMWDEFPQIYQAYAEKIGASET